MLHKNKRICWRILEFVGEYCGSIPTILTGDFNFFTDADRQNKPRNGIKYLQQMELFMTNVSKNMFTDQEHRQIFGTYIGYPHDDRCEKDPRKSQTCLDYIFSLNVKQNPSNVTAITKTFFENEPKELSDPYMLPSDHLALVAEFIF